MHELTDVYVALAQHSKLYKNKSIVEVALLIPTLSSHDVYDAREMPLWRTHIVFRYNYIVVRYS